MLAGSVVIALVLVAGVVLTVLAVTRSSGSDQASDGEATSPAARTHAGLCTALRQTSVAGAVEALAGG